MNKKDILEEFMAQWDTIKKDKVVTIAELEDYYKDISATIDRDDYFEMVLRNAWKLPEPKIQGGEAKRVVEDKKVKFEDEATKFFGEAK